MYARYQRFICDQLRAHRGPRDVGIDPELAAWALVGIATAAHGTRELRLLTPERRKELLQEAGRMLLSGG
jgi:hypothetical protein